MTTPDVAVVMGTYNRLKLLEPCVVSVRRAVGKLSHICLVADGGSTDGSREWLLQQPDCELLEGGLGGAVKAYNVAFARAVDLVSPFVVVFNDDAEFLPGDPQIEGAVNLLRARPEVGAVNLCLDRYGKWEHLRCYGVCYGNYIVVRRETGMAVARALNDPEGKAWWDRHFHSYASDTAFGLWLWRLGWTIHEADEWRVHDPYTVGGGEYDPLRVSNMSQYTNDQTNYFVRTYPPGFIAYSRSDAESFGGFLR
jgi:GT2 family glycosyltransferase